MLITPMPFGNIFVLISAAIFLILGWFGIAYCVAIGCALVSLYCFLMARISIIKEEIILGYSLAIVYMIDTAEEISKIYYNTNTIIMHPAIKMVYVRLNWIAIVSFVFLIIAFIKQIRPPKK